MENTKRKYSMKSDAKARRERNIARLESQLKTGTKTATNKFLSSLSKDEYVNFLDSQLPENRKYPITKLTDKNRERIQKEIDILKTRI
jgi:hypothetical protein